MLLRKRTITIGRGALVALLLTLMGFGSVSVLAQESPAVGVVAVAYACPNADVEPSLDTCDTIEGVTIQVEVNGTEIAGSPLTTALNPIGFNSIEFNAPEDATITLTQLSGVPEGYTSVPGANSFVASVSELPILGTGGESTSPYALLVNIPVEDEDTGSGGDTSEGATDVGSAGGDTQVATELPSTGSGTVVQEGVSWASMLLASGAGMLLVSGLVVSRRGALR